MKRMTLIAEKGGVGKTTNAVNIAAGIAIQGGRVLLIDSDPQGHATESLGQKKLDGLVQLLAYERNWSDLTVQVDPDVWAGPYEPKGTLHLMPGHKFLAVLPQMLGSNFLVLRERLAELEGEIDVVVFDTSPNPNVLHGLVYLSTDAILFPAVPEYLSLDGLKSSLKSKDKANETRETAGLADIQVLGVLPTMVNRRTNNHRNNLRLMHQFFEKQDVRVWHGLSNRTVWTNASQARRTIFAFAGDHQASREMWDVVDTVIEEVKRV